MLFVFVRWALLLSFTRTVNCCFYNTKEGQFSFVRYLREMAAPKVRWIDPESAAQSEAESLGSCICRFEGGEGKLFRDPKEIPRSSLSL